MVRRRKHYCACLVSQTPRETWVTLCDVLPNSANAVSAELRAGPAFASLSRWL